MLSTRGRQATLEVSPFWSHLCSFHLLDHSLHGLEKATTTKGCQLHVVVEGLHTTVSTSDVLEHCLHVQCYRSNCTGACCEG